VDMQSPTGLARFAPVAPARKRAGHDGEPKQPEAVTEHDFYG